MVLVATTMELIMETMRTHPSDLETQRQGCGAFQNLVAVNDDNKLD